MLIVALAALVLMLMVAGAFVLWESPQDSLSGVTPATPPDTAASGGDVRPPRVVSDTGLEFRYPGEDGKTVLELLKGEHEVVLDSELLLFGSIVLAIDSFVVAADQYWIYYRDSTRGDRSPEVCTTYSGETIRWVLRRRK
jgi:hypothetical protein